MTAERRLAKLEGALSPKAATLLWLAEAHQFGSLSAYVAWLIDQPISAAPLERVPAQARAAAVAALRGQPREAVREAAHQAVRDAIFLVELVLRLNSVATETIRIEGLRYAVCFWELRAITAEAQLEAGGRSGGTSRRRTSRWPAWRAAVANLVDSLCVVEQARAQLERRYLDKHASLFPDLAADWLRLRAQAEELAGLGEEAQAPPLRPGRRATPPSRVDRSSRWTVGRERAGAEAAHQAEIARGAALDLLGDTRGAAAIAERRFRPGDR
jgi:hypothetical protein